MTMNSAETSSEGQREELLIVPNDNALEKSDELNQSDHVTIRPNIINRNKRVSFHFGQRPNTIQNICDTDSSYNKTRIDNKNAYLKLHRHSFSARSNLTVEKLKEKYENNALKSGTCIEPNNNITSCGENFIRAEVPLKTVSHVLSNKQTSDKIDKLREKYSPQSFGYPKTKLVPPSKIPVPSPRNSSTKQRGKLETVRVKLTTVGNDTQVPVITEVTPSNFQEVQLIYNNIKFAEPEDKHFIVTRSSSEDSVLKLKNSLADFVMDKKPKEKKRSSSFRRILSGGLFGRDKKKHEDGKPQPKTKDNAVFSDNVQNESQAFDRHVSQRHTVDSSYLRGGLQKANSTQNQNNSGPLYYYKPQQHYVNTAGSRKLENRYTEMKGNNKQHNNHPHEDYVQMDNTSQINYLNVNKFIDTSSSSSNTDSDSRNYTYQNALIAQAELRVMRENENRKNALQANVRHETNSDSSSSLETFRSTPPHNQKSVKNVELVRPKALIPINSERPLPNPYHNVRNNLDSYENLTSKTMDVKTKCCPDKSNILEEHVNSPTNVVVDDIYGTVFDSISSLKDLKCNSPTVVRQLSPRSLEGTKLKLPSNREKIELQPRIRSPIPQAKISTDKIIATELLRNKGSPSRSPMGSIERQQKQRSRNIIENQEGKLLNAHSTPKSTSNEYIQLNTATSIVAAKPPRSPRDNLLTETQQRQKESQHTTLAMVHGTDSINYRNKPISPLYVQENAAYVPPIEATKRGGSPAQNNSYRNVSYSMQNDIIGSSNVSIPDDLNDSRSSYPDRRSPLYQFRQTNTPPMVVKNSIENPYYYRDLARISPTTLQAIPGPRQPQRNSINSDVSYGTPFVPHNVRPHTPITQNVVVESKKSPEKQHMIQNVEAFYWRELKKLKEKEEQDLLNYRRQQFYIYGYAEEPVVFRRSRSVSPSMQRGQRSLSLPREGRSHYVRSGPETILEGRPMIDKRPIVLPHRTNGTNELAYGQIRQNFEHNPNFVRNTFERTTIGPIGRSRYYEQPNRQNCTPIFKRGSLTSEGSNYCNEDLQINKKVSFSNSLHSNNPSSWPTKNGFTQSPPTRRVDRELSTNDDVFVLNSPRVLQNRQVENIYMNDFEPTLPETAPPRGTTLKPQHLRRPIEPYYESAFTKHVTVSDKVCDIYGQIHDPKQTINVLPQNYGQIRQVGFVYGQVQQNSNQHSPVVMRQSFDYLNSAQPNFVRGTRLTASVNDMYRRYPIDNTNRVQLIGNSIQAPNRPLPPVPERRDSRSILAKRFVRVFPQISDAESGSEAGEVQRILNTGVKQKHFGAIGK